MNTIYKIFTMVFCLFVISNDIIAQNDDVNYFMRHTPMSYKKNPALMPTAKVYVNIPTSGINLSVGTSGFVYKDAITRSADDSLHLDLERFSSKLSDNNYFRFNSDISLLGFGFAVGEKNYFSFDLGLNMDMRFNFSKGLIDFLIKGTDVGSANIMDGKLLSLNSYIAPSIAYTRVVDDKLTLGARIKLPMGIANIKTDNSKVNLDFTSQDNVSVLSDFRIKMSNIAGKFNVNGFDDVGGLELEDVSQIISNAYKNMGLAVDLGGTYRFREDMEVGLSVVDLGFINWKTNTQQLQSKRSAGKYVFNGFDIDGNNFDDISNQLNSLTDSLISALDLETVDASSYTAMLPTKIYASYTWSFYDGNTLNALYKASIGSNYFDNQLSLFYSLQLERYFNLTLGNTFSRNGFLNPSAAINFNAYFLNFYLGAGFDSSFNVAKMSGVNFFFGMNFAFGYKDPWIKTSEFVKKKIKQ